MKKILVVIDMQKDFITGALGNEQTRAVVSRVCEKIKASKENADTSIFYTKDTHGEDYLKTMEGAKLPVVHCIEGTDGWELIPEIDKLVREEDYIVCKETFGAKDLISLLQELYPEGVEEIELVGVCTDICVIANAMIIKAYFPNSRIIIDEKCCAGVTEQSHEIALKAMAMCHIEIV